MSAKALSTRLRISYAARRVGLYAVLILGAVLVTFPFLWMILTSFKTYGEAISVPPTIIPSAWANRVHIVLRVLGTHPGLLAALLVWLALGVAIAWRIRKRWLSAAYVLGHLALFAVAWQVGLFGGALRWGVLRGQAAAELGYELLPFWTNYVEAWNRAPFGAYFGNSLIMSTVTPFLIVVTAAPAAYAFARMRFPAKNLVFMLFLATMMIPQEVILIPNFITVSRLGWIDKYPALIVPWIVNVVTIFFLRQFFMSIPDDLYDAAVLDGCSHAQFLVKVALPLSVPALVSTSLFNFLGSWNAVQWPLYVTNSPNMRPLMVGMRFFSNEAGMSVHLHNAAATFTTIPVIILFLLVQRRFIEGIARTGIK